MDPIKNHHSRRTLLPGVQKSSRIAFAYGLMIGVLMLAGTAVFSWLGPKDNFIQSFFSSQEVGLLKSRIGALELEKTGLEDEVARSNELVKLDKETMAKMGLLISNLEAENAKLKEDLAFFEGFIPASQQATVSLKRLQVSRDTIPGQYSYKALVIQGSERPEVSLNVQLLIKISDKQGTSVIVLPRAESGDDPKFKIRLTRFSRINGTFVVPEASKVQSVEMRILEGGTIRAQSSIKL